MTPQIGRPVQYFGTHQGAPKTFPAMLFGSISGETATVIYASVDQGAVKWTMVLSVSRDAGHATGTWDYVPD